MAKTGGSKTKHGARKEKRELAKLDAAAMVLSMKDYFEDEGEDATWGKYARHQHGQE